MNSASLKTHSIRVGENLHGPIFLNFKVSKKVVQNLRSESDGPTICAIVGNRLDSVGDRSLGHAAISYRNFQSMFLHIVKVFMVNTLLMKIGMIELLIGFRS